MRIAIVNSHKADAPGGSEVQSDIIARGLSKRGHYIAYIAPGGRNKSYESPYDVITCRKDSASLIRAILDSRPDIIYWRYYRSFLRQSLRAVKKRNIPFVFVLCSRSMLDPWYADYRVRNPVIRFIKMIRNRWQYGAVKHSDLIISINRQIMGNIDPDKEVFLPLLMESDCIDFSWPRPYCAWVSNLRRVKRPEKFIELAERMRDTGIDFLMAGMLSDDAYRWIADGRDCPDNLYYIGAKSFEEINGILKSSLFHVHTCEPEGFGNVFVQAWMQKKPSLSLGFDPGGYIKEKETGYTAHNDMDRFERYARKLIEKKDLREEMGKRAYDFATGYFSFEKGIDDLENLLISLIKEKGPGGNPHWPSV